MGGCRGEGAGAPPDEVSCPALAAARFGGACSIVRARGVTAGAAPWRGVAAGILCRWARSHRNPDDLSRQFIAPAPAAGAAQEGAEAGAAAAPAAAAAEGDAVPAAPEAQPAEWWWRNDGTLPARCLELPVAAALEESRNALPKDVVTQLRCAKAPPPLPRRRRCAALRSAGACSRHDRVRMVAAPHLSAGRRRPQLSGKGRF